MGIGRLQPLEQFVILEACLLGVIIIWLRGLNLLCRILKFPFKASWVNYFLILSYSCFICTQLMEALSTYVIISLISCNLGIYTNNFYTQEATQTWEQVVQHSTNCESISQDDGCKHKPRNQPLTRNHRLPIFGYFGFLECMCLWITRHFFFTIIIHDFTSVVVIHINKKAKKPNILNNIPNDIHSHPKINVVIDVTMIFCNKANCQNTKKLWHFCTTERPLFEPHD